MTRRAFSFSRHGSVEGYLHHAGLTDDELARARARLRD